MAAAGTVWWAATHGRRMWRSRRLHRRFGPEYERLVGKDGRDAGERALMERLRQHDELALRSIARKDQRARLESWATIQATFVDTPVVAVRNADQLVFDTLREAGYPLETVDVRAAALSVDFPALASRYRDAHHALAEAEASTTGPDVALLHTALLTYRELLQALVTGSPSSKASARPVRQQRRRHRPPRKIAADAVADTAHETTPPSPGAAHSEGEEPVAGGREISAQASVPPAG